MKTGHTVSRQTDYLVGALIWAALGAYFMRAYWGGWPLDLTALYFAGHFFQTGAFSEVYGAQDVFIWSAPPEAWQDLARQLDGPPMQVMPYVYPPLWAGLMAPVTTLVGFGAFAKIVFALNLVCFGLIGLMVFDWARRFPHAEHLRFSLYSLLACGGLLVGNASNMLLILGQPQVVVTTLTVGAFWCAMRGRAISAGAMLALAAALKLTPLLFVALFVFDRNWRAVASFAVVGATLAGASVLLAGWPLHQIFLDRLAIVQDSLLVSQINLSLELGFYEVAALITGQADLDIAHPYHLPRPAWTGLLAKLIFLVGAALIWILPRSRPATERLFLRFLAFALLSILCAPLAWSHYLILPLVLLPGVLGLMPLPRAVALIALPYAAFSAAMMVVLADWGIVNSLWQIGGTLAFLVVSLWLCRQPTSEALPAPRPNPA